MVLYLTDCAGERSSPLLQIIIIATMTMKSKLNNNSSHKSHHNHKKSNNNSSTKAKTTDLAVKERPSTPYNRNDDEAESTNSGFAEYCKSGTGNVEIQRNIY